MADTTPDFDTMTRADLITLRGQIDKAIASAGERDRQKALKAADAVAREHGFSLNDLTTATGAGKRGRGGAKAANTSDAPAVRFRNPEDHTQTWSGRGRRPAWYNEALAADRPIEDLKTE